MKINLAAENYNIKGNYPSGCFNLRLKRKKDKAKD